jgi:hypothetical protein
MDKVNELDRFTRRALHTGRRGGSGGLMAATHCDRVVDDGDDEDDDDDDDDEKDGGPPVGGRGCSVGIERTHPSSSHRHRQSRARCSVVLPSCHRHSAPVASPERVSLAAICPVASHQSPVASRQSPVATLLMSVLPSHLSSPMSDVRCHMYRVQLIIEQSSMVARK